MCVCVILVLYPQKRYITVIKKGGEKRKFWFADYDIYDLGGLSEKSTARETEREHHTHNGVFFPFCCFESVFGGKRNSRRTGECVEDIPGLAWDSYVGEQERERKQRCGLGSARGKSRQILFLLMHGCMCVRLSIVSVHSHPCLESDPPFCGRFIVVFMVPIWEVNHGMGGAKSEACWRLWFYIETTFFEVLPCS